MLKKWHLRELIYWGRAFPAEEPTRAEPQSRKVPSIVEEKHELWGWKAEQQRKAERW